MPEATEYFSKTQEELRERGLALDAGKGPAGELPPGGGEWVVSHYHTFAGITNLLNRAYYHLYDEAMRHSRQNADAIYRDLVVQEALFQRKYPTAQVSFHVEPHDETDPEQVKAAAKIDKILHSYPEFDDLRFSLLDAIWYGRSAVQVLYKWQYLDGETILTIRDYEPIAGDKLQFKYGGDVGILVNALYNGPLEKTPTSAGGYAIFLPPEQREALIVHRHERVDASYFDTLSAGAIEGVGIRGRIYWFWYLRQNILAQLMDYVQRFCSGIKKGRYPQSNPNGKATLEANIAASTSGSTFVSPTGPDFTPLYDFVIEETGTANPAFLFQFINSYFDYNIRRYILGQIEAVGESGGVGGDEATLRADSLAGIRRWDAKKADASLNRDLIPVLYKYNAPNIPPGRMVSDLDLPNATEVLSNAKTIRELGGDIDIDHCRLVAGLPKPRPNSDVASAVQSLSPVAVGQVPEGVPVAGAGGPQPVQQDQQQVVPSEQVSQQPVIQQQPTSILTA